MSGFVLCELGNGDQIPHYKGCSKVESFEEIDIRKRYLMPDFQLISQELCLAAEKLKTAAAVPENLQANIKRPQRVRKPLVKHSPSDYSTKYKFKFCICKERKQSKTVPCSNKKKLQIRSDFSLRG
jgi:hypothetical protein